MEALIIASLRGDTTPAEEARLSAWRRSSPANEASYRETVRVWEATAGAYARERSGPVPPLRRLMSPAGVIRLGGRRRLPVPPRRRWAIALATAVAAGAVMVVLGVAAVERWRPAAGQGGSFGAEEFVTGRSEGATVALRDGTVVRLAPGSRLRVVPGTDREVALAGRAYFAVASDEERPFRVRTAAGDVKVLGTRFELRVEERSLRLVVLEGRVALAGARDEAQVTAGQMSGIVNGVPLPAAELDHPERMIEWLGGFVAFQSTPLVDAAAELERTYGIEIQVVGRELGERKVSGWYTDQPIEHVMRAVCLAVLAECSGDGRSFVVRPL